MEILHVWNLVIISFTLMFNFAQCQPSVHPSVSDILAGTSILENAVIDLSSAAVTNFVENAPTHTNPGHNHGGPAGSSHVDMPGEHGNQNDFPVVHREPAGGVPIGGGMGDGFVSAPIFNDADGFNNPVSNAVEVRPLAGPEPNVPKGIFHGINVFHESGGGTNINNRDFVDLAALGDVPIQPGEPVLSLMNPGKPLVPVNPVVSKSHGFLGQPVEPVGIVAPQLSAKEVVVSPPTGDGFVGDGFQSDVAPIGIADAVHEFEKTLSDGNVGAAKGHEGPVHHEGVPDLTTLQVAAPIAPIDGPGVHVDLPGEHGNTANAAVVHRDGGLAIGHPEHDPAMMSVHVDLPGEHGNTGNTPVVHRGPLPLPTAPTNVGIVPHADHHPNSVGNVHIDLPGQHGNIGNTPVVHREPHVGPAGHLGHDGAILPVASPGLAVHVDLPGQHGNMAGTPVVHRDIDHNGILPAGPGNVHVDLPGEHGNMAGTPVVHREVHSGIIPAVPHPVIPGNVHVDLPGVHGNMAGTPVVHREVHSGIIPAVPHPVIPGNVHVDLPGEHGNIAGTPVVHRDIGHGGILPTGPVGHPVIPGNVHVDHPGEHGNMANVPVVHREPGVVPIPGVLPALPVNTAIPLGAAQIGGGMPPHDLLHPVGPGPKPHGNIHHGIHIDAPGEHGNPHNEPALHLPPGATVEDAVAAGVIPPPHKPVVPTGVLPGTPNVPVKPNLVHIGGGKGIFGPDSTGLGIVSGKNVLLGKGGRRRNKNRKNRRRGGGRRCDRRGRCRDVGGRGKKGDPHDHDHQHHEPKPTSKPNSGVIVIRHSRPNPLGALANAVRGMLGSNGNGGGLLGSILRSAAGAPGGPPPGVRIIGPGHGPQNLMQSVLGNLFGKR